MTVTVINLREDARLANYILHAIETEARAHTGGGLTLLKDPVDVAARAIMLPSPGWFSEKFLRHVSSCKLTQYTLLYELRLRAVFHRTHWGKELSVIESIYFDLSICSLIF